MAYGERHMRKELGGFGMTDFTGMGLAAAFGIVAAIVFDLTQHGEGSALFVMNKWVATLTQMVGLGSIPLYGVVLLLMGLGAASILYFQPVTMRGAFAQGFGALAALATVAPSDLGAALPESGQALPAAFEALPAPAPVALPIAYAAQAAPVAQGYDVRLKVRFSEGLPEDVASMVKSGSLRGKLRNATANQTYNLFRNGGAGVDYADGALYFATRLPGNADAADLLVRIEAEGYEITTAQARASLGPNPVWAIDMPTSTVPLFLQRMRRSYDF